MVEVLILLTAAMVLGTVAERLGQSTILGYLVAGTLVGPNVLGLVPSGDDVKVIAELGAALLLFSIGLEFSFRRLKRLGAAATVGGALQMGGTIMLGAGVAWAAGLDGRAAAAVGLIAALSSTACVLRVLVDRAAVESVYGRTAMGVLLFQDAAVIPLMLVMTSLAGQGGWREAAGQSAWRLVTAGGLIGSFYLLFKYVVPRVLNLTQWSRSGELPILLAVVLAVGAAVGAHESGLSPALGAFVAGVLLGESPMAVQIRADVGALRTLLVTVFFASIGLMGDPVWAAQHGLTVGGVVVAVVVGKAVVVWGVARLLGLSHGLSAATGLCLAQVGEFSFLLAQTARGSVIDEHLFRLVISAMILTLFLTPFLVAAAPRVAEGVEAFRRLRTYPRGSTGTHSTSPSDTSGEPRSDQIVVPGEGVNQSTIQQRGGPSSGATEGEARDLFIIGFGPAGQHAAAALLKEHRERMAVIDMNPKNVATARSMGLEAFLGNACHREVLEHAHIHRARLVLMAVPDPAAGRTIIHHCRNLAPGCAVVARARFHVVRWELMMAGAAEVVDEEEQMGLRMAATGRRFLDREAGAG